MNRLIIIGNGFDLAHGLKTSYFDFIQDYLVNAINEFSDKNYYEDPLLQITHAASQIRYQIPIPRIIDSSILDSSIDALERDSYINFNYKSSILQISVNSMRTIKWVDLENLYFDELLKCMYKNKSGFDNELLLQLNLEFDYLKMRLEKYLETVQVDLKKFKKDLNIDKLFRANIERSDILNDKIRETSIRKTMYLNFNYTNTLDVYTVRRTLDENSMPITTRENVNHIHGRLATKENPIIFGFGDEYDKNYIEFENFRNNEVFKHIKSFAYFKTKNYHDLVKFLTLDKFQVFIIGHSCGLSDRTMFREIFEHEQCVSIKIFYYKREDGSTDFVDKTFDIARHFTNKGEMRKKIVSEPNSKPFPQYSNPSMKK